MGHEEHLGSLLEEKEIGKLQMHNVFLEEKMLQLMNENKMLKKQAEGNDYYPFDS